MRKPITTKKIVIILSAVLLVTAAVFVVFISNHNDTEVFRSIMIYELDGNALIERADGVTIDAIESIYLDSGDRVRVSADSMMRLKLDNDKYIVAEANSIFTLVAEGNEKNSLTRINLERGAITNEIQNPLSKKSVYETSTPNSVMAVRGTIYRVELYENEEGELDTRMCCFQGTVATTPVLPDGSTGEEVLVHAGNEVTVYKDGTATEPDYINFETLPSQVITVLDNLNVDMTQHSSDELKGIVNNMLQIDTDAKDSEQNTRESFNYIDAVGDGQADDEIIDGVILDGYEILGRGITTDSNDTNADTEAVGNAEYFATNETVQSPDTPGAGNADKPKPDDQSGQKPDDNPGQKPDDNPGQKPDDNPGQKPDDNPGQKPDDNPGQKPDDNPGQKPDDQPGQKPDDQPGQKPDVWPEQPPEPKIYTVTFKYGNSVFATQSVAAGEKAQKPLLKPAKTGSWDFDFDSTTIDRNITIVWSD